MAAQSSRGFNGNTLDSPRDDEVEREVEDEGAVVDKEEVEN